MAHQLLDGGSEKQPLVTFVWNTPLLRYSNSSFKDIGIRCTDHVFRSVWRDGKLAWWKRRLVQRDGACSCGADGIVRGPTSLASSTGLRWARVAAQYLGASSR